MKNTKESILTIYLELRQKENTLKKEKESLDDHTLNFKNEKNYVEVNIKILNTQLNKLDEEETKIHFERDSFEKEKSLFFNLNFLVNNSNNLENRIGDLNKFQKCYLVSKRPSFKKEEIEIISENNNNQFSVLKQNNSTQNFNLTTKMLDENNNIIMTHSNKICLYLANNSTKQLNIFDTDRAYCIKSKQSKSENNNIFKISINQQIFNSNHTSNSTRKIIDYNSVNIV